MRQHENRCQPDQISQADISETQYLIPEGALRALWNDDIKKINQLIGKAKAFVFEPEIIDEETFVSNYGGKRGELALLEYISSLQEDKLLAFITMIDVMNAGIRITANLSSNRDTDDEYRFSDFEISHDEGTDAYEIFTTSGLARFITDYTLGKIVVAFNAKQLVEYLLVTLE